MNNFEPEDLLEVAKQKSQESVTDSLAWKLSRGFSTRRLLRSVGVWMVARGKKMQALPTAPSLSDQISFLQNKTKKLGT